MSYVRCADFLLTGLTVLWPVLLWSGNLEPGVAAVVVLLLGLFCCGVMAADRDVGL